MNIKIIKKTHKISLLFAFFKKNPSTVYQLKQKVKRTRWRGVEGEKGEGQAVDWMSKFYTITLVLPPFDIDHNPQLFPLTKKKKSYPCFISQNVLRF